MSRVSFEPDYANTAAMLVNDAINDAIQQLEKQFANDMGFVPDDPRQIEDFILDREQSGLRSKTPLLIEDDVPRDDIPNIEWMSIDKFGRDSAEEKIKEFIIKVTFNLLLPALPVLLQIVL